MPSLLELQRQFSEGVLRSAGSKFMQHIRPGRFAPARHFQVYRNNVFESLTNALKAVYPVTERLVGDGFFRYAAASYIPLHRPESGNLHDFGEHFAGFLSGFPPARELVYLPDVARLEWAMHESFHAGVGQPLALTTLSSIPAEEYGNLRFRLQPSARLLASSYPILRIWQVNQPDHAGSPDVNLEEGGVKLLVIRRQEVEMRTLSDGDYSLLSAIDAGSTLAQAARAAMDAQADYDLTGALASQIQLGTLAQVENEKK
ncbi:MAG: DNA-binding domain-containing protein [Gammaproteobacteria bacterium]|nr:DNA-binding domain-containing protein [Gammaproteobacteria bacterium]